MDEHKDIAAVDAEIGNERRTYPHVREAFPVMISNNGETYRGLVCDISANGLSCSSDSPLPVSGEVSIDMFLPDREGGKLVCQARMVRTENGSDETGTDDNLTAFNFTEISPADRGRLEKFIAEKQNGGSLNNLDIIPHRADIYPNGISCVSDTYIPPFREVEINVFLPENAGFQKPNSAIKGAGVVVKSEKEAEGDRYNVHLYFTDIADSDRRLLQEYIKTDHPPEDL